MTDNEIVTQVRYFADHYSKNSCLGNPSQQFWIDILDFINRQKAEIEMLKSDVSVSRDAYLSMKDRYEYEKEKVEKAKQKCIDIGKALKTAKAEAIKECIEKVKSLLKNAVQDNFNRHRSATILVGLMCKLDTISKELVGEDNVE